MKYTPIKLFLNDENSVVLGAKNKHYTIKTPEECEKVFNQLEKDEIYFVSSVLNEAIIRLFDISDENK